MAMKHSVFIKRTFIHQPVENHFTTMNNMFYKCFFAVNSQIIYIHRGNKLLFLRIKLEMTKKKKKKQNEEKTHTIFVQG